MYFNVSRIERGGKMVHLMLIIKFLVVGMKTKVWGLLETIYFICLWTTIFLSVNSLLDIISEIIFTRIIVYYK